MGQGEMCVCAHVEVHVEARVHCASVTGFYMASGLHNSGNYACVVSTLLTEIYSKSHKIILKIQFGNCKMASKQMNLAKLMNWVLPRDSHGRRRDSTSANVVRLPHTLLVCGTCVPPQIQFTSPYTQINKNVILSHLRLIHLSMGVGWLYMVLSDNQ